MVNLIELLHLPRLWELNTAGGSVWPTEGSPVLIWADESNHMADSGMTWWQSQAGVIAPEVQKPGQVQLIAPLSSLNPPLTKQGAVQAGKDQVQEASGGQGSYFHLKASQRSWVVRCRQEERALGDTLSRHLWNRNFISFHAFPQNDVIPSGNTMQRTEPVNFSLFIWNFSWTFCKVPRISCLSYTEHKVDRRGMLS